MLAPPPAPPPELTSLNRARYADDHLHRLRLVRAMVEPGGLSIADAALARREPSDRASPTSGTRVSYVQDPRVERSEQDQVF
ncbi:MerR family transcriptional regulator [Saccharothrix sp. S26]|uniref:MerR family transcriptional regulator n=1 Tax=Saccharothrix sp. S26 TaxID=2907215 RepID=UPI0027E079B6|nr:MerR family transcriptional regulator [Saccharothrix sp. S26]